MNGRNLRLDPQHGIDFAAALVFGQLSYVVIGIMRPTFRYSGLSEMARGHLLFLPEQSRLLRSKNSATYIPDGAPADAKRSVQTPLQLPRQQSVKQVFARFSPDRESSRAIRSRAQPALHGLADPHIFLLYPLAHRQAFGIP
jgi:hypothetical protein